jgi:hypothetical protein
MTLRDEEDFQQDSGGARAEESSCKKPYESPALIEWGTITDLTHGPTADIQDDGFSGSGGV